MKTRIWYFTGFQGFRVGTGGLPVTPYLSLLQELEEPMFLGRPPIYKVEEDDFIFVQGDEYEHVLWVYAGSPEPVKPEDVPEFLK